MRRTKLSKKSQERQDDIQKKLYEANSGGIIGNSNCIGTNLNGWILNLPPTEINPIVFLKKRFTLIKMIEHLIGLAILN